MAGRSGTSSRWVHGVAGVALAALALGAGAAPLAAQGAQSCSGGDCEGAMSAAYRRAYEAQVAQLQEQLGELLRREQEPALQLTLRRVDSVLKSVKVSELGASRELSRLQQRLDRESRGDDQDVELRALARQLAALQMRLALTEQLRTPAPTGYLGVTFSGDSRRSARQGELYITHHEYPAIISVEPGSPAAKAGVHAGDTLIAYNRLDVVRDSPISLSQLLRPGAKVTLNVRRDGRPRALAVVVGEKPRTFERENMVAYRYVVPPVPPVPEVHVRTPRAPREREGPTAVLAPLPPTAPSPADPGPSVIFFQGATGTSLVAGAEVTRMNADLRDVFGTDRGVLVLNVAQGTPAAEAGLRGGDVILACDGASLSTPAAFRAALARARNGDKAVTLEVVRKKKTKKVVLEW